MCALKLSLSTAKGKRMTQSGSPRSFGRPIRLLRLLAALAVIVALIAIVTIVKGDPADRSQGMVLAAIVLGAIALFGMGLAAWPHIKKEKNDPRP